MGKRRRDWKAITIDWDEVAAFDDTEQQSVCLTQMEAAILKALLIPAYWATRWYNLSVSLDALQEKIAHIDAQLDGGCTMFQLRQNPFVPCLLEQSFDSGETWSLAFDYSKCKNTDTTSIQNIWNIANEFNVSSEVTYDDDIVNIYPVWDYTGGSVDADNDAAMCMAIQQWVEMVSEFIIQTIENGNADLADDVQFWSDLVNVTSGAAMFLGSRGFYPVTSFTIGGALMLLGVAIEYYGDWALEDSAPYQDLDARDEVVCALYDAMAGNTPTYSAWSSALSAPLTGNAEIIRNVVHDFNSAEMAFVDWLGLFADLTTVGYTELGNECAACSSFTHIWEIDELSGVAPHTTYNNDAPTWTITDGTYVPSVGIDGADIIEAGKCRHRAKITQEWSGSRKLTRIRFDYDWAQGDIDDWGATAAVIIVNGVIKGSWTFAQVQGNSNKQWTGSVVGSDKVVITLSSSYENENGCGYGGTAVIERVVIEGVGVCPFD